MLKISRAMPDMPSWAHLQAAYDLSKRECVLRAADESSGGQPELLIQISLLQVIEGWKEPKAVEKERLRLGWETDSISGVPTASTLRPVWKP